MKYSIGFAIIGAGVIARFHARAIKALGRPNWSVYSITLP